MSADPLTSYVLREGFFETKIRLRLDTVDQLIRCRSENAYHHTHTAEFLGELLRQFLVRSTTVTSDLVPLRGLTYVYKRILQQLAEDFDAGLVDTGVGIARRLGISQPSANNFVHWALPQGLVRRIATTSGTVRLGTSITLPGMRYAVTLVEDPARRFDLEAVLESMQDRALCGRDPYDRDSPSPTRAEVAAARAQLEGGSNTVAESFSSRVESD